MRTSYVHIIVGRRKSGKTDLTKSVLRKSSHDKILIVDTFDNPAWRNWETHDKPKLQEIDIPVIPIEKLENWNKGAYRLFASDLDDVFQEIDAHLFNTAIVFEDARKYIGSRLKTHIRNSIIDSKQKNIDLFFVFHSFSVIPKELVTLCDFITIFKTIEDVAVTKKIPHPSIPHAFKAVQEDKNRFANITIEIGG